MDEKVKILFVDDEENVLTAVKRVFMDAGYTILTALSGKEALKILEENDVQVIVSDYRMPDMNGIELLKVVRKQREDIIRIILSGYADLNALITAVNEGHIYKFIPKPWNDDELRITISNALDRYFLHKKNLELTSELKEKNRQLVMLNSKLKEFMEQQSAHLESKSKEMNINQHIIDSLPIGISFFDFKNMVFRCNPAWKGVTGDQHTMPEKVMKFVDTMKTRYGAVEKVEINGISGKLLGVSLDIGREQKVVTLAFIRDNIA
ncbi:MAG: response regulator [Nitrospiraceae bacterium]|nr:response regulator [Nitrospirota bacterium]MDA8337999.1 response regulator [Nitrospiraceae bacterium]